MYAMRWTDEEGKRQTAVFDFWRDVVSHPRFHDADIFEKTPYGWLV